MLRFQEIRLSGWKLLAFVAVGAVVLLVVSTLVVWLALALLVLLGLFAVHAVYLPRLSIRLGVSTLALSALLFPLAVLLAWAVVRAPTAALLYGTGLWLLGVVAPQLVLRNFKRELYRQAGMWDKRAKGPTSPDTAPGRLLEAVSCRECGWTKFTDPTAPAGACPRCNLPLRPPEQPS